MEIGKKAYRLNLEKIDEGWAYSDVIVYAETRGKAKLLIDHEEYKLSDGSDCTFLNMPIMRSKQDDKYLVAGALLTKRQIDHQRKVNERNDGFDQMLKDSPTGKAYIMKGGLYWRANSSGYTEIKHVAGVYDLEKAVSICKSSDMSRYERPVLINPTEHNEMITNLIERLNNNLI